MTYTYDLAGQRTKIGGTWARTGLPAAVTGATYDDANQLTNWGGTALTHDANGNLTAYGTTTYTWNVRNQLTAVGSTPLEYDGLGRRQKRGSGNATTEFVYDGLNPVQEKKGNQVKANLVTGLGLDEYLTRIEGNTTRHLLPDALGSTLALTDAGGTVKTEYTYEPFGKTTQTGQTSTNSFKYTGREDDGTGLYYYRARYYLPGLGRFISEDPVEFEGGDVNLYAYVWNDPLSYVDPSGLGGAFVIGGRGGVYYRPYPGQFGQPPSRNFNPPLRPIRPTPNPPLRPGPGEPPLGPNPLEPHLHPAEHPHPWAGPGPCSNVPCIGPAGIPGTIGPLGGPPPTGGRKDPPTLPPPCPPLDQMMGLCAPPQT